MSEITGSRIHITGVVQGVGFRPFVYGLATGLGLNGWVRNTSAGVDIAVDGPKARLEEFARRLQREAPPLAHIHSLEVQECAPNTFTKFEIIHSAGIQGAFQPISADVATCPDCLREIFDPHDRRFRYPFTNCTNCGPRFTIIQDIPYDRPKTSMADFQMCPQCQAEYEDPLDRRFHAQPVACPACGPQVWLEMAGEVRGRGDEAILALQRELRRGQVVAIKGLGGFHLACDATNELAVQRLRQRKLRVDKPFALMVPDLETAAAHCLVSSAEAQILTSIARPIVLLQRRASSSIAEQAAPGQHRLGLMLPYTPLHSLLFAPVPGSEAPADNPPQVLVMTSGNLSEEPIVTDNEAARTRLAALTDAFLMHDRPIHMRCDDSVVRVFPAVTPAASATDVEPCMPVRRSRGYAPAPVRLPWKAAPLLATGAELKNTFCLLRQEYAFLSHHIGDLENYEAYESFESGIAHFERLFRIQPAALAYDLHPDYLATRYAQERSQREGLPALAVQHHHAHIAAAMAEHGLPTGTNVIGLALDGTGYGIDGAIWGAEFLIASYTSFIRQAHLAYIPLPGGDRAVRQPWRTALSWLAHAGIEWGADLPPVRYAGQASGVRELIEPEAQLQAIRHQIHSGLNAPQTSSAGRLFDAVAALLGVRQEINYEAQAAIELEAVCDSSEPGCYPFELHQTQAAPWQLDPSPLLQALVRDLRQGTASAILAQRFHNSLAEALCQVTRAIREASGLQQVVLSGGVWQNATLLRQVLVKLEAAGFTTYIHQQTPCNDGGIALGQAAVALHTLGMTTAAN